MERMQFETNGEIGGVSVAIGSDIVADNCKALEIEPKEPGTGNVGVACSAFFEYGFAVLTAQFETGEIIQFCVDRNTKVGNLDAFDFLRRILLELQSLLIPKHRNH